MSEPTRHELKQFLCNRCNQPDAELFGMMVSHDEGRWVSYEDYAKIKEQHDFYKSKWEQKNDDLFRIMNLEQENARLKAEVERLTAFTTRTIVPNEELQKQVEQLTKTYIDPASVIQLIEDGKQNVPGFYDIKFSIVIDRGAFNRFTAAMIEYWKAAKEGKDQP